jgi:hypothetical protein
LDPRPKRRMLPHRQGSSTGRHRAGRVDCRQDNQRANQRRR